MDQPISESSIKPVSKSTIPYLPTECLRCILSFIEDDDIRTLHSILLLNRTWCKNTAPILWKKPFTLSAISPITTPLSLEKIIPIYLSYLPEDFLDIPEMQNIKKCVYERSTLFDYASFLKELDYKKLYEVISQWVSANKIFEIKETEDIDVDIAKLSFRDSEVFLEDVQDLADDKWISRESDDFIIDTPDDDFDYSEDEIGSPAEYDDDDLDDCYDDYLEEEMDGQWSDPGYYNDIESIEIPFENSAESKKLMIAKKICLYLMSQCRNFQKLILDTRGWTRALSIASREYISLPCFPGAAECLSNATEFILSGEFDKSEIFNTMATYCKNIRSLMIMDAYQSSPNSLANLISVQKGLKLFTWCGGGENSSPVLWSFASQGESIVNIQLINAYTRDYDAFKGLAACKNLENLKISECQITSLHMKALANANFPRLKSIEITDIHIYDDEQDDDVNPPSLELASLIHNANTHLQEIKLNLELHFYPGIIETIANNCPNLITFSGNVNNDDQFAELKKLLMRCKRLENLIIYGIYWGNLLPVDDVLPQISHLIPETLKHLDLTKFTFSEQCLKEFLTNCKAKLKFMAWHCYFNSDEHKLAIEAYAREKGINVLDFHVNLHNDGYGYQRIICHISVTFDDVNN